MFEAVRPASWCNVLYYVRENNHFYKDIIIKPENFSGDLISLADTYTNRLDTQSGNKEETWNLTDLLVNQLDIQISLNIEEIFEPEDSNDHLDQYKSVANETCLVSLSLQSQMEKECIAPGEGRQLKAILNDEFCE